MLIKVLTITIECRNMYLVPVNLMHKSKLIRLLRILSSREFRKLGELAHSPIYNKNEKVRKLYLVIDEHYPDWENVKLSKEKVFSKVFPVRKYNDKYLRAVMSDLAQLAETLMVQIKLESDPFLKRHLLFGQYPC